MAPSYRLREHTKAGVGVAFVALLVLAIWGTYLSYSKSLPWQDTVDVTLVTESVGLGLTPRSDVKLSGLRVGEVREITTDGRAAVVYLALDPRHVELISPDVDAVIVPKTLFGEKFVDLRTPARASAEPIRAGDEIRQSTTAVEVSRLFDSLGSLLDTLDPQQLSTTLTAMADTLDGKGGTLGTTLDLLHTYVRRLNPHLDTVTHDLTQTARTAEIYADSADDLLRVLDDARAISTELLVPRERSFAGFLQETIEAAGDTTRFLRATDDRIATLVGEQRPLLQLLADYSGGLPCLTDSLVKLERGVDRVLGGPGPYLKVSVDTFVDRRTYTYPRDLPSNPDSESNNARLPAGIASWAPHCPVVPERLQNLADQPPYHDRGAAQAPAAPAASPRHRMADAIAGRLLARAPGQVPPVANVLLSPLLAGEEVHLP